MNSLKIERLDHKGRGISYIDGKIIFIDSALESEDVCVNITSNKKKYYEGELVNIINKSNDRVDPICPFYSVCGGCNIMHMNYIKQLDFKEKKVIDIINKYVHSGIKINSIIKSDEVYYRNKISLKVDKKIGLYKKKTNDIVNINKCFIVNSNINKIINILSKYTFDSVKEIVIKSSMNTNETMVVFDNDVDKNLLNELKMSVTSIYLKDKFYFGNTYLTEVLGDFKFLISPLSFFQVNTNQALNMYLKVLEYCNLKSDDVVLDLYCGTGTIGIFLSKYSKSVIGIEINESSIINARMNSKLNNCNNVEFYLGDVGNILSKNKFKPNVIVVDPPRSGLDDKTRNIILKLCPKRIVYVSCDPMTLSRDLKILEDKYDIIENTPFDMFPNTYHVETVCLLTLKSNIKF